MAIAFTIVVFSTQSRGESLSFSSTFGGSGARTVAVPFTYLNQDVVQSTAIDEAGNIYVAGTAFSADFPLVNPLAHNSLPSGGLGSPFVAKLDPTGTKLLYSSVIGPPQIAPAQLYIGTSVSVALTIDSAGNAYVTGATPATSFPGYTAGPSNGGYDVFVIKLDPNGNLLSSMVFGGSGNDSGNSIALDSTGAAYITGVTASPNFPASSGAYRTTPTSSQDIFIAKLDNGVSKILYATYLGPGYSPQIAIASATDIYVAANTTYDSWPASTGAVQPSCSKTCADLIVLRFNAATSQFTFATYLGGSAADTLGGIASDAAGTLFLAGTTASSDFPVTPGAFQQKPACSSASTCNATFVTHMNPSGTALFYSTYLGGSGGNDQARGIALDPVGDAYITGLTDSADFPIYKAIQTTLFPVVCAPSLPGQSGSPYFCNAPGGFLAQLNPQGSALVWSTYLGGVVASENPKQASLPYLGPWSLALDSTQDVFVGGQAFALDPVAVTSNGNATIMKISPQGQPLTIIPGAITDSATFRSGIPQGGGLASAFVSGLTGIAGTLTAAGIPLPTALGGVSVKVGGELAPILSVSALGGGGQQINFQVPFDQVVTCCNGPTPFSVEIQFNGVSTFTGAAALSPGIFVLANGVPAVQHAADYSLVTSANPVVPGETIIIYLTGLGPVTPAAENGAPFQGPANLNTGLFSVNFDYGTCRILYAGAVPGSIGLYQVNCQTNAQLVAGVWALQLTQIFQILGSPAQFALAYSNAVQLPVQ